MNEDKSTRYHRLGGDPRSPPLVCRPGYFSLLLASGLSIVVANCGARRVAREPNTYSALAVAVYVVIVAALHEAITFPLAFYQGFLLERRYGLSKESPGGWLRDRVKAAVLALVLSVCRRGNRLSVDAVLDDMVVADSTAGHFIIATAALTRAAPVLLLPLFYRFTPLSRESLRNRLVSLSQKAGVPVLGVYEWALGEKSRRANAALVGTGSTRRILLSDTLLAEYSDDEIEVILAHEIAHHVHHDILGAFIDRSRRC